MICLQGGAEFTAPCRDMDAALLAATGATGPVVVVALAGAPGREYEQASRNGVSHFIDLGADAVAAPDARTDPGGALAAVAAAGLVVLPGGSPARLLGALAITGMGAAIIGHVAAGRAVMGSSAGAMALCDYSVLPGPSASVAAGLGLVPGCLVIPHYRGSSDWEPLVPEGVTVLGLPECSGLFVEDRTATAVGVAPSTVGGSLVPVGESVALP